MRVLVCGGRNYGNVTRVAQELDALARQSPLTIIEGGATGADAIARAWWKHYGRGELITVKADWKRHGKAAGPIRNQQMLVCYMPDLVLAFPGGRGTADMVARAKAARVPVREINEDAHA
jgi:hypothetical protein